MEQIFKVLGFCLVVTAPFGAAFAAEDCGPCQVKIEAKKKLKDSEAEYTDLLRRNKEFLAKVGPSDNSKLIKLNSNITLINIKLEGIQKNISELDAELGKEDCVQCMPPEAKEPAPSDKPADPKPDLKPEKKKKVKSG